MKTKLLSVLLLLIFTPCTLFAARPSINSLQTQVNQLGSEVNQIDERVSNLEALHTEPALTSIGQVQFTAISPSEPVDLVSVSLDIAAPIAAPGRGSSDLTSIVLQIPHSVLIPELGKLAASGLSAGDVIVSFKVGGVFRFVSAGIDEMIYSPANNPRIVMLRLNYASFNFDTAGGGCPSGHYVDLTDSTRTAEPIETPVSVFNFSVGNSGGGAGSTANFDAGLTANLGELTACVIQQALDPVPEAVIMDRYSDAISVKDPALKVELTNALIKSLSVRTTSDGALETAISYVFDQILWTSQDATNKVSGGWDLVADSPL